MDTEQRLLEKFGQRGLDNLKAHAKLLNMSLDQVEVMAEVAPVVLLEALQEAMLKKQRDIYMHILDVR